MCERPRARTGTFLNSAAGRSSGPFDLLTSNFEVICSTVLSETSMVSIFDKAGMTILSSMGAVDSI